MTDSWNARFDAGYESGKTAWECGLPCQVSAYDDSFESDERFCEGFRFGWMAQENEQRKRRGEYAVGYLDKFSEPRK